MGSINFSIGAMFGSLSEVVGTKSGLALTKPHIIEIFDNDGRFLEYGNLPEDNNVRIESITYEEMVELLLYSVGRLEKLNNQMPIATLLHKYGHKAEIFEIIKGVSGLFLSFMKDKMRDGAPNQTKIDPREFMTTAFHRYGQIGLDMAYDTIRAMSVQAELKFSYFPESHSNIDIIKLDDLFRSEGLSKQSGMFIDQRYIDFINRNFDQIDDINWRKFEALTAEYFSRLGFEVDIGPGRNDDGVDVRVWPSSSLPDAPPAIIVQCKRQKATISKVIVKALYTDVIHQNAKSGLIVTTSRLSPGAQAVCDARKYPIETADRAKVRDWVSEMRKPGMGVIS
jgi:restriction system protein